MKVETALMNYPVMNDVEMPARQSICRQLNPRLMDHTPKPSHLLAATVVMLAGTGLMYLLLNYGQIFQSYLIW